MKFLPRNRRLLLERVSQQEKQEQNPLEGFALPEGVQPVKHGTQIYKVLAVSPDCSIDIEVGNFVVVEEAMVNVRQIGDLSYTHVQENYVEGVLKDEKVA